MDSYNDSSSNPYLKPGPQTPGTNKRLRSEDENATESQIQIIHQENLTSNNRNLRHQRPTIQQNEIPPITLEFKSAHNSTDRKLTEELIKEWKMKNNKELEIIGRFGFKNVLLIFARNTATLDELLDKNRWPIRINGIDYSIKYPKVLPEMYSLVIKDFQLTWKEEETAIDLQEKYASLIKITRLVTRDGRPMNIARADFRPSQLVNQLINQGEIDINSMKLYVRPYFAPIKINKCRKCFKHDHFTNQCISPQLCFRCGQQHSLENGCKNDIKCVNCEQQHYSGHPACPMVQQRRKQIAEQQKLHHAQLLVKQQQQHQKCYDHDLSAFPHLIVNSNTVPDSAFLDSTILSGQTSNQRSYASIVASKSSGENENIEQLIMSLSNSINQQLTSFTAKITSQIASVAKRIDTHSERLENIENRIQEKVIPAIYELSKIIDHILEHNDKVLRKKTTKICYEIIEEWCWTCPRIELFIKWKQRYQRPARTCNNLAVLHYNIRNYYTNQCDLIDMVENYKPAIISINELGIRVPLKSIEKALFTYKIFLAEGSNPHGGVVLAIDKNLNPIPIDCQQQQNIVAASILINNKTLTITSVYSPPTEALPLENMSSIMRNSQYNIIMGDFNAKNYKWGCAQVNKKGRELDAWLQLKKLHVHNPGMTTSLRSKTTIDLIISTEQQGAVQCQQLPYNGSDHIPILTEYNNIKIKDQPQTIPKINWDIYTTILTILNPEIEHNYQLQNNDPSEWFKFFQEFLYALKLRSTSWHKVTRIRPSITEALRVMIKHKHYLQNRYRHTRTEQDRPSLRSWHKLIQSELKQHRVNCWNRSIDNVASPQPTTFWNTIKILNKKRSVEFSAITENNHAHRTPTQILSCLTQHFKTRFQSPLIDLNVKTDKEAHDLWELLERTQPNDIQLICQQSDLVFTTKEMWQVLKSLKSKNSSGFDNISNKMIKNLPEVYVQILTNQYNALFAMVYWEKSWKQSRTICFNKVETTAPTTQQLRPISLLPVLSKVYERLFLLRFKKWLNEYGILPWQQSGARPNQCTTSRVNHLLEQTYTSLISNTFTPIVFVDFLQAFDLLG